MNFAKILGQSVFFSSIQAALASVEMSSRFSIMNFARDQETLQNAADALKNYMIVAFAWTFATVLVLGAQYGFIGSIIGLIINLLYISWIYFSYINSFKYCVNKYGLIMPKLFFSTNV